MFLISNKEKPVTSAMYAIKTMALRQDGGVFFYVAANDNSSEQVFKIIKESVDAETMFWVQANAVNSVTLDNGSEITVLPLYEANELFTLPKSNYVFIEANDSSRDLGKRLQEHTHGLSFVDGVSRDML